MRETQIMLNAMLKIPETIDTSPRKGGAFLYHDKSAVTTYTQHDPTVRKA